MIAIKNMRMPTRCIDCPIYRDESDLVYYCPFVGYMNLEEMSDRRDKTCPLTEIVKCKDCKHYKTINCSMDIHHEEITIYRAIPNGHCNFGERKEE